MTRRETALLLAMVAAFDRRTGGEADVIAWHSVLDDVDFAAARDAVVAHFRDGSDWLMPAEIRKRVAQARRDQINAQPAIDTAAIRQTIPPPEWFELRKRLAARPRRERASFAAAMQDMAGRLEQTAQVTE